MGRNRFVRIKNKLTSEEKFYKSVLSLVKDNKNEVGVTVGAVWNGLSRGKGYYENRNVIITYVSVR